MMNKNANHVTHRVRGEVGIVWFDPSTGEPTKNPPQIPWVRESVTFAWARTGPLKVSKSVVLYGWSILGAKAQKPNPLATNLVERRLLYLMKGDLKDGAPLPYNAVRPDSIKPGMPGTRIKE
jgi:hypothetical protein